jgi:hypothetical protein
VTLGGIQSENGFSLQQTAYGGYIHSITTTIRTRSYELLQQFPCGLFEAKLSEKKVVGYTVEYAEPKPSS